MAQALTQSTAGTMVKSPRTKGRKTRRKRWDRSGPRPRRRQSMAVKKPLSRKNTGMRNPWMAAKSSP